MKGIQLYFAYKTTFRPTNAVFYGIHLTDDIAFGNEGWTDPFVGTGAKVKELLSHGAKRSHFDVQMLCNGTLSDCERKLAPIFARMNYDDPLCLNGKDGAPAGVPKTELHKQRIAESTAIAMKDNDNALGAVKVATTVNPDAVIDPNVKLKWFNDGTRAQMLHTYDGVTPLKTEFSGWQVGQLPKKAAVAAPKRAKPTVSTANLG